MLPQIGNALIAVVAVVVSVYNLKSRRYRGKVRRALGPFAFLSLVMAILSIIMVGIATGNQKMVDAGTVLNAVIALDNFFNSNDPPSRRRRSWLKNKFAKLAPARS